MKTKSTIKLFATAILATAAIGVTDVISTSQNVFASDVAVTTRDGFPSVTFETDPVFRSFEDASSYAEGHAAEVLDATEGYKDYSLSVEPALNGTSNYLVSGEIRAYKDYSGASVSEEEAKANIEASARKVVDDARLATPEKPSETTENPTVPATPEKPSETTEDPTVPSVPSVPDVPSVTPTVPTTPTKPSVTPTTPAKPSVTPTVPVTPSVTPSVTPTVPTVPTVPATPTTPVTPTVPTAPAKPTTPAVTPAEQVAPAAPSAQANSNDLVEDNSKPTIVQDQEVKPAQSIVAVSDSNKVSNKSSESKNSKNEEARNTETSSKSVESEPIKKSEDRLKELPNTSEVSSSLSIVGLMILSVLAGFFGFKKRNS